MATIKFFLQSKRSPANIYVRLIDGRKVDVKTKTNFVINPGDWSESKQKPKNLKDIDFKNLDVKLQELRANLLKEYNNSNTSIDLLWLKNFINPIIKTEIPQGLVAYIDFYKYYRGTDISEASKRKFNLIKAKMQRFEISRKKTILMKEINNDFKKEFVEFYAKNDYSKNTMQRELVFLKTFCNHARTKGVELSLEFDGLRLDRQKAANIYLTFEELEAIKNIKKSKLTESLENARDWLIISCYTAQRVSDFMRFKPEMIREQDGKKLIEFKQVKTNKIMTLPLHFEVLKILEKRSGQFPYPISDQKYNKYIKIVAEKAELTQLVFGSKKVEIGEKTGIFRKVEDYYRKCDLVSSHIGRRSFASNFYGKIPTSLLISATGHSTEQMFLVYIGKSNSDKAMQLADYF